jgi:hypothetical protein
MILNSENSQRKGKNQGWQIQQHESPYRKKGYLLQLRSSWRIDKI